MPGPLHAPSILVLFPFRFRDPGAATLGWKRSSSM